MEAFKLNSNEPNTNDVKKQNIIKFVSIPFNRLHTLLARICLYIAYYLYLGRTHYRLTDIYSVPW